MLSHRPSRSHAPSVPRIYATSMTTPAFRWLHEEGWDGRQLQAFAQLREAPAAPLYAPPPLVRTPRKPTPLTVGRWLLTPPLPGQGPATEAEPDLVRGIAEAQLTQTQFTTLTILLSPPRRPFLSWGNDQDKAALTLLISALILISQADQVRLLPLHASFLPALAQLGLSPHSRDLWVPLHSLSLLSGGPSHMHLSSIDIDPGEWWTLADAAAARSTLSYLEKRLVTLNKAAERAFSDRKRPGLLRLFSRRP